MNYGITASIAITAWVASIDLLVYQLVELNKIDKQRKARQRKLEEYIKELEAK